MCQSYSARFLNVVIPAIAGIQDLVPGLNGTNLDARLRGHDEGDNQVIDKKAITQPEFLQERW